jgi:putative zinc finger protein
MTCPEARELLSALLDEALSPSERQAVEAHLTACADCQRELAELRETVALLNRLPPAHAPAGFVDRVVEKAYRPSWPRRVADAVFRPLRVKLPLEAAAVVLVGISALYVYQRAPEVREVARQEPREPSVASSRLAAPPAPSTEVELDRTPGGSDGAPPPQGGVAELEAKRAPNGPEATPPVPAPPAPAPRQENVAPQSSASSGAAASATAPAPPPEAKGAAPADVKKEVLDQRREDPAARPGAPGIPEKPAQSAESAPSRDAGPPTAPVPAPPRSAAAPPEVRSRAGASGAAPSEAPAAAGAPRPFSATSKSRAATKLTRAVDASGRLVVAAPEPAEIALDALLGRLGGTRVARRIEGPAGRILVDVIIPAARYAELLEGLGTIGRWTTEHEPKTLPAQVTVEVAVSAER